MMLHLLMVPVIFCCYSVMQESNWIGQPSKGQGTPLTGMGDWEEVSRSNNGSGGNNKKKKKVKQLVDPSILGFSVNAAERPNIGEIQTIDDWLIAWWRQILKLEINSDQWSVLLLLCTLLPWLEKKENLSFHWTF